MSEPKHMNRGFLKDKLGSYQVDPPGKVWDAISGQIGQRRKRRGMYILVLATAASIALAVSLGIYYFGPDLPTDQALVDETGMGEEVMGESTLAEEEQAPDFREDPLPPQSRERRPALATQEVEIPDGPVSSEPEAPKPEPSDSDRGTDALSPPDPMEEAAELNIPLETGMEEDVGTDPEPEPGLLSDTAMDLNRDPFPVEEPVRTRKSRWMVGAAVSPLYSYRDADAMAIPPDQAETGLLSYSTGIHVRYSRNSRLAIETGVYYNRTGIAIGAPGIKIFSQRADPMVFGMGSESADINTVSNSVGNIVAHSGDIYLNGYKITAENGSDAFQAVVQSDVRVAEAGIQQHLDYLELPFNLRYTVIDRSLELQLVGGVSTNFLVGNSVTMKSSSGREEIGYLSNVNTVNYAGNAGLGMIYHMGSKMSLFLEPRFRYFLNSVNDASLPATRPYSLGFYTGLSYTF